MKKTKILILLLLLISVCLALHAQTLLRHGPIVRQVDHILIESGDPQALFNFFTKTLDLPTAWPIISQPGFTSGGVGVGNVNLEIFQYDKNNGQLEKTRARFSGIAFEPYPLAKALPEMQSSGIPFSSPEQQYSILPNGFRGVALTMVKLPSFSNPEFSVFLYEYSQEYLQVAVRRKQLGNRLTLNGGGRLGVHSVKEIVIAVAKLEKKQAAWKDLLNQKTAGAWNVGAGPAIRLVQGRGEDRIQGIVLEAKPDKVKSAKNKMLLSPDGAYLNPDKAQQLSIRLVDSLKPGGAPNQ
jgi:hypothetical protein